MGFIGKLMRGGMAAKAAQVVKREASKPENQRRAKDMLNKFTQGGNKSRGGNKSSGGNKPKR